MLVRDVSKQRVGHAGGLGMQEGWRRRAGCAGGLTRRKVGRAGRGGRTGGWGAQESWYAGRWGAQDGWVLASS